jgi:hypothetical protein
MTAPAVNRQCGAVAPIVIDSAAISAKTIPAEAGKKPEEIQTN